VCSQIIDGVVVTTLFLFLPEGEVLLEELNDALGITEVVLLELVDLVESLLESVISELASLSVILEDLVVEDGEVEGKSELDGVASGKVDAVGILVSLLGLLLDVLEDGTLGILSDVTVVITDHLDEESLGLLGAVTVGENLIVDKSDDLVAVSNELGLDFGFVVKESIVELRVLGVLLDGRDGAAGGTLAADEVLEGNGKKVALIGVDLVALLLKDITKEVDHVLEALGLFGDAGKENFLFNVD